MCRLALYWGPPILISEFLLKPSRSIIKQSYDARERLSDHSLPFHLGYGNLNGDGFGIGWYSVSTCSAKTDTSPCTFTSVTPAWNNDNLNRLAAKLESGLIFAHVRAAYPGMPVSEQNCHPFAHGDYLFMHNGVVAGFLEIRRKLLSELSDEAYNTVQSFHSDSAVSFALFLHHLPNLNERQPPDVLLRAMQATIATISRIQAQAGITDTSLLNFVVTDGNTTVATRYVSTEHGQPASLYYAEGSAYERGENDPSNTTLASMARQASATAAVRAGGGEGSAIGARSSAVLGEADYHLAYGGVDARVCLIASEPVTSRASDWVEVPRNTALVVCREKDGLLSVMQAPITPLGSHPRLAEIYRSLESVIGAAGITGAYRKSLLRLSASNVAKSMIASINPGHHNNLYTSRHHHPHLVHRTHPYRTDGSHGADFDDHPDTPRVEPFNVFKISKNPSTHSLDSMNDLGSAGVEGQPSDTQTLGEHLLTGHRGSVMAVCTHGDLLFSGSTDCSIKVWCLKDCKYLTTLMGHRDPIRCLSVSGGALISAGAKTIRLWSLVDFSCLAVLAAADVRGSIKAFAISPDGRMFVGGQDCRVKIFPPEAAKDAQADSPRHMADCDTVRTCTGTAQEPAAVTDDDNSHCSSVTCLALFGNYLCSGSSDSTIRVWKSSNLEFVKVLRGHRGSVLALHAIPGLLLSGGRDHVIRAWDADTLVCRRTLAGHKDDILDISSFVIQSQSESFQTSQFVDGTLPSRPVTTQNNTIIESNTPHMTALLEPGSPRVFGGLTLFATSSADGTVKVWSPKDLTCLHSFTIHHHRATMPTSAPNLSIMSCALTQSFVIGGMVGGNIVLFPAEDVYSEVMRREMDHRAEPRGVVDGEENHDVKRIKLDPSDNVKTDAVEDSDNKSKNCHLLEREFERALRIFIQIKTVSADPSLSQACFKGAKFLLRLLESMGAEVKLSQPVEGKNPVVLGRLGADPSLPTVTMYGHYDVQPAFEPEWRTDPFEVAAIDGYLIGRGVSDNKGPILAFVYAVKELLEECRGKGDTVVQNGIDWNLNGYKDNNNAAMGTGSSLGEGGRGSTGLPCNVVFLFEGEEENGSIGFKDSILQSLRWFEGTQAILISNTLWVGERRPCITYGMRGMITMSVEVRGAAKDLHSGNEGGVFSEPLADLNKVLASLIDSRSNVSIPGFYDNVRPDMLETALQRLQASAEFSLAGYKKALGVKELTKNSSERELLTARWCQPTLSVVDVRVGTAEDADTAHYRFGPTRFSVIPRAAVGKISIRFVPDQTAEALIEHVSTHIHHEFAKLRSGNSISVKVHSVGDWWEANPSSDLMKIAEKAVTEEWGETPLLCKEGGTMPVASALEKMLDAPALLLPMGQSSDNCHLANERIRRLNLMRGKNVVKRFLLAMAEKRKN